MIFLHGSAHPVGVTRYRQQCFAESSQLIVAQLLSLMVRQQLCQPEDFSAQVVAQPGQKRLIQQQTAELASPETG